MTSNTSTSIIKYTGIGTTSKQPVTVEIQHQETGHGIKFEVTIDGSTTLIPATADKVVNTLRNMVIGEGRVRLCIVEHLLAAISLCGLTDLLIRVDGPEIPLDDGSAKFWVEKFESAGWRKKLPESAIQLTEPILIRKDDKMVLALPDENFSMSYLIDWEHPQIGKRWQNWSTKLDIHDIADARTFGWLTDHQMLGIAEESVSLTADGFTKPLRFVDEPVRHKLLDLIGDLTLSGTNPCNFKAQFISIKAGHELDAQMAKALMKLVR